jgi:ADP-ribose pyrophosphatase YjhB (NUDIX family)
MLGVSIAVFKNDNVLLIQRGKPPFTGSWSFPGGKVMPGEQLQSAARRELLEETELTVGPLHFIQPVEFVLHQEKGVLAHHIVLMLFAALWRSGEAKAAGDAKELRWVKRDDLSSLSLTEGLEKLSDACWESLQRLGA